MRNFSFISVLMGILAMTSCVDNKLDDNPLLVVEGFEKPVTETTDEYRITFQYNEGVIALSEAAQDYIVRVEADSIIYFASSLPSTLLPEVGSIVTSRVSDKLPFGLGSKVIEVSEQDGTIRCVTTLAQLDDIYKELSWEYNASLTDSLLVGYVDQNGNNVVPDYVWYNEETGEYEKEPTKGTIGHQRLVQIPFSFPEGYKPKDQHYEIKGVGVEGSIYVGAFVHCSGDVRDNNFEFYVEPIIGAEVLGQAGIIFNKDHWQDMYEWNLFKLKDIIRGVIQLGPLTLRPYVDIEAYLEFAASGTISAEVGKTFSARIGYSQTNGCYISNSTVQGKEDGLFKKIDMLNGNLGAKCRCLFDVGCGLFTKKTAIEITPYFEYSLGAQLLLSLPEGEDKSIQKEATASFDIVAGADGKMVVDWFGNLKWAPEMKFIETNLFHAETSLIPELEEDSFSFKKMGNSLVTTYDSAYNISGGLLSNILEIYPGIAIYKDTTLVYKELYTEKTAWNEPISTKYTISGLEADASYDARPIARILGFDLELDKNLGRWVDLGLPSGILWAAYNVGATSPEEYGGYYAWGETEEKSYYGASNYRHFDLSSNTYINIGQDISGSEYDVASIKWGDGARMPKTIEIEELLNICNWHGDLYNDVLGVTVVGPNKNCIFIPCAGKNEDEGMKNDGWVGYYRSANGGYDGNTGDADGFAFYVENKLYLELFEDDGDEGRIFGLTVRPVKDKPKE